MKIASHGTIDATSDTTPTATASHGLVRISARLTKAGITKAASRMRVAAHARGRYPGAEVLAGSAPLRSTCSRAIARTRAVTAYPATTARFTPAILTA